MAASKNKITNKTSNTVRDVDQPVRQSKSANSSETDPVSNTAVEKNTNTRNPRRRAMSGVIFTEGFSVAVFIGE